MTVKQYARYRSREEIIYEILTAVRDTKGVQFTKLLFLTHMSSIQLQRYLHDLLDSELIVRSDVGRDVAYVRIKRSKSR